MKSEREAKKILKAYGKAEFRERVNYVDSFLKHPSQVLSATGMP